MSNSDPYRDFAGPGEGDPEEEAQTQETDPGSQNVNQPRRAAPSNEDLHERVNESSDNYDLPDDSEGCAIIGPSGSGKTTFLAALERACEMPDENGISVEFYPEPAIAYLIRRTISNVLGKRAEYNATFGILDYGFRICVTESSSGLFSLPTEIYLKGNLSDSGGGIIFPLKKMEEVMAKREDIRKQNEEQNSDVIDRLRKASTVILCVDATQPNINLLYERMTILLSQTRDEESTYSRPLTLKEKMNYWIRRRPIPEYIERKKPALRAERFLLLLTHIDQICESAPNPERMARLINPVVQAREILGEVLLQKIRKSLRPSAQFAVGVCSPWGFSDEEKGGKPFADREGQVLAPSNQRGEELLLKWKPFGIRDAIYFIATGKCRGSVKEVTEDALVNYKPPTKTYSNV